MIKNLENKLKFIELLDKMKDIERAIILKNGRFETDAEHVFHIAMMVVVFIGDFPELDELKTIKIALLHDLVEIFAGDTVIFDKKMTSTKEEREKKALDELEKVFGEKEFEEFRSLIEEYEEGKTEEAKFVYQLDKLQAMIQCVMEGGEGRKRLKMKKDKVMKDKYDKITDKFGFSDIVRKYEKIGEENDVFYIG